MAHQAPPRSIAYQHTIHRPLYVLFCHLLIIPPMWGSQRRHCARHLIETRLNSSFIATQMATSAQAFRTQIDLTILLEWHYLIDCFTAYKRYLDDHHLSDVSNTRHTRTGNLSKWNISLIIVGTRGAKWRRSFNKASIFQQKSDSILPRSEQNYNRRTGKSGRKWRRNRRLRMKAERRVGLKWSQWHHLHRQETNDQHRLLSPVQTFIISPFFFWGGRTLCCSFIFFSCVVVAAVGLFPSLFSLPYCIVLRSGRYISHCVSATMCQRCLQLSFPLGPLGLVSQQQNFAHVQIIR